MKINMIYCIIMKIMDKNLWLDYGFCIKTKL